MKETKKQNSPETRNFAKPGVTSKSCGRRRLFVSAAVKLNVAFDSLEFEFDSKEVIVELANENRSVFHKKKNSNISLNTRLSKIRKQKAKILFLIKNKINNNDSIIVASCALLIALWGACFRLRSRARAPQRRSPSREEVAIRAS